MLASHARELKVAAHACQQFRSGERLDQIVVGAGVQTFDGRFLARPGGQEQYRHAGRLALPPQGGHELKVQYLSSQ